jgi:hypothetical protein
MNPPNPITERGQTLMRIVSKPILESGFSVLASYSSMTILAMLFVNDTNPTKEEPPGTPSSGYVHHPGSGYGSGTIMSSGIGICSFSYNMLSFVS